LNFLLTKVTKEASEKSVDLRNPTEAVVCPKKL
jgi:hypothetical protein